MTLQAFQWNITCGLEKKESFIAEDSGYSLEAFLDRLSELCSDNGEDDESGRGSRIKNEAQYAVVAAREAGLLKEYSANTSFVFDRDETFLGSEHAVELDSEGNSVVKVTRPPGFGFIPAITLRPKAVKTAEGLVTIDHPCIGFVKATPREYLTRWIHSNEVFEDQVSLTSVIQWKDGTVSFCIRQPFYGGEQATFDKIDHYFRECGWTQVKDPLGEHEIYMNYAFQVLAMDAMPRNCKIDLEGLQPFDVILCTPDEELENYLKLY